MSSLTNPAYEILPPSRRTAEAPSFRTARHDGEDRFSDRFEDRFAGRFENEIPRSPLEETSRHHFVRFLTMFVLAVAAITAWHSYGHAARARLASLSPRLAWLAPPLEDTNRVEQISRSVDRIAATIAANQEQLTRTIDHLAADQEQMTRNIARLQLSLDKSQPDAGGRRAGRRSPQAR
jgi:hypothetical protein